MSLGRRWIAALVALACASLGFRGLIGLGNATTNSSPPVLWTADDFNRCGLDTRWTVTDPIGDLVVGNVGAGTGDSWLTLSIGGSATHDPWVPNTVPRITKPVSGDFTLEAKFASGLSTTLITGEGVIVEDGAGSFLRFDVYRDGSGTHFFVGSITPTTPSTVYNGVISSGAVAPLWIRVTRSGTTWDATTSTDGTTFTHPSGFAAFTNALAEVKAGVFVANEISGGSTPAFTAQVDYVNIAAGAPASEDVGAPPDGTAHTLTVTTSGTGTGSVTKSPSQTSYYCGELVTLTAVPSAGSVFSQWTGDVTSNANPLQAPALTANRTVDAAFALQASSPPVMAITPTGTTQTVTQGSNAATGNVSIRNTGGGTLHWGDSAAVSCDQTWITPSPTSGTTTTETDSVALTYTTSALTAGSYSATCSIPSSDVATETFAVNLTVNAIGTKVYPDGSTDTGFNAPLASLGGQTCQQHCGGVWTAYTGTDTPAAGATIDCKTTTNGFKLTHDNITLRCSDISDPGDTNGIIKVPSGATANNFLIEGNKIHNSHTSPGCATQAITIYKGWGTIQYNDIYDVSDMYVQPGNDAFTTPVQILWNFNHANVSSDTCNGSHDESIHLETGQATILHNRFEHTTAAQGFSGTACVRSESNPGVIIGGEWGWNLLQGGGYLITGDGNGENWHDNVMVNNSWQFTNMFTFAHTPANFSGNKCDNGHPLTLSSTNCSN